MRALMTCLLILVPAGLAAGRDTDDWIDFNPKGGKCTVKMPAKPKDISREIDTAAGTQKLHMYAWQNEDDTGAYMVAFSDYPEGTVTEENVAEALSGAESGFIKGVKGKRTSGKAIKLQKKHPGREFACTVPALKGSAKCRVYFVADRLYQVVALGNEEFMDSEDVDFFLNSFRLTTGTPKKDPDEAPPKKKTEPKKKDDGGTRPSVAARSR